MARKAAKIAGLVIGVPLALGLVISAAGGESSAPEPAPVASSTPTPTAEPVPTPALEDVVTVTRIIDGDTIDTSAGAVRVIGIDTPEKGVCGFGEATDHAATVAPVGSTVTLVAVNGKDDTDKYDRLLRYVVATDGTDLGTVQITDGFAIARYDSRDGYGTHPKEAAYIAADAASDNFSCDAAAPAPVEEPGSVAPAGETDPNFGTCKAAKAAGYGPYVQGTDPEYSFYRDANSNGIVCE